jgi:hypothetical protein
MMEETQAIDALPEEICEEVLEVRASQTAPSGHQLLGGRWPYAGTVTTNQRTPCKW